MTLMKKALESFSLLIGVGGEAITAERINRDVQLAPRVQICQGRGWHF